VWSKQASKHCLAVNLKLDISIVREFLSQEEFHLLDGSPDSPAMSTGPVTAEFLSAGVVCSISLQSLRTSRFCVGSSNARSCTEFCVDRRGRDYEQSPP
jgi:hypothetical protein